MNPNTPAILRKFLDAWRTLDNQECEVHRARDAVVLYLDPYVASDESLSLAQTKEICNQLEALQDAAMAVNVQKDAAIMDLLHDLQHVPETRHAASVGDPAGVGVGTLVPGSIEAAGLRQLQRLGWDSVAGKLMTKDGTTWTVKAEQPCILELNVLVFERAVNPAQKAQQAMAVVRWNRHDGRDGDRMGLLLQTLVKGEKLPNGPTGGVQTWHVQRIEVPESYRRTDDAEGLPD